MGAFMEKFSKKSVKAKLNFMSKFSIIAMVIMGIGAVIGAMELNMQTKELSENWMVANNIISDLDYNTSEYRLKQYQHLLADTASEKKVIEDEMQVVWSKIDELITEYELTISSETDRKYYEQACEDWANYLHVTGDEFFELSYANQTDRATAIMLGEGYEAFSDLHKLS